MSECNNKKGTPYRIKKIFVKKVPWHNGNDAYSEYYACPCGNHCIVKDYFSPLESKEVDIGINHLGPCILRFREFVEEDETTGEFVLYEEE